MIKSNDIVKNNEKSISEGVATRVYMELRSVNVKSSRSKTTYSWNKNMSSTQLPLISHLNEYSSLFRNQTNQLNLVTNFLIPA